ncbi:hypothetical protein LUZ61_017168 [Rhynchospora tenuis]|uniref:SWIM-type domain-containing protein n=1 Tax=Rhynchospora tenuis TaxID=198213 RepID=A0AAD5Z716_9POAL|nr:hypothetical protein LUZ61_017168 [Rhynchospora tenuis]
MFPISIYTEGAVENGPMGATYNKPPSASYPAQDDITFDELKRKIFELTGINEDKNSINVNARWNAGTGGSYCFVLLPICENSMWRMLVEKTLSSATGWSIVELFVEAVPNSVCTQNDPGEKSHSIVDCTEKASENSTHENGLFHRNRREENQEEPLLGENAKEHESQDLTDDESIDLKPYDESTLYKGRLFDCLDDLKRAVKEYHIKQNRKFVTKYSGPDRYVVKCMDPKCGWTLYAPSDRDGSYYQIKKIKGEHVCSNEGDGEDHVNMSHDFISQLILDLIRKKGDASPKEIQEFVYELYGCTPSYSKAWRAKELAITQLFGEWKESYAKLAPYLNAIQVANPGTKVEWLSDSTVDPNVRLFRGVAWAFAPAIEGFKNCRPVISIDSTKLCGKYGGRMLIAVAYDAEGQLLPLAFAAIKDEDDDESWSWFMHWLRLEVVGPSPLCVISDRQDSILSLFKQPDSGWYTGTGQAFHRYCSRYLCESIPCAFKTVDLVRLVQWVASQNQLRKFRLGMMRIMETNLEAYNWLVKVGTKPDEESAYHLWSLCEDGGYRYGIMAANGNESIFNLFPGIQELPITALVELTFVKSAETFARKREATSKIEVEKQQLWSNKITAILEARRAKASQHRIVSIQSQSFLQEEVEVETRTEVKHTVRVGDDQRSCCSCQKPQLTGIPCSHLLAFCAFRSVNANYLVDSAYGARRLLATWAPQFHPPPSSPDEWPDYMGVAYSPVCKMSKRGRRKKNVWSPSVPEKLKKPGPVAAYSCGLCKQIGHSKRCCSRNTVALGTTSES